MTIKVTAAKQSIHLTASPKVTLDQLNKALAKAVGVGGCLGCGLLGIDIHFHGGDPVFEQLRTEGIEGAMISAGPAL